jgi:hypothetical protein
MLSGKKMEGFMETTGGNLLDLFIICNVPSTDKFQLFCRYLSKSDIYMGEYFDEDLAEEYSIPEEYEMQIFYNIEDYEYREIENSTSLQGYSFGIFDSYEDAVQEAKRYSSKELLDKFFGVYNEAKEKTEKELQKKRS